MHTENKISRAWKTIEETLKISHKNPEQAKQISAKLRSTVESYLALTEDFQRISVRISTDDYATAELMQGYFRKAMEAAYKKSANSMSS
ncbi:hypothetical protein D3C81_2091360 [compost metagenome]